MKATTKAGEMKATRFQNLGYRRVEGGFWGIFYLPSERKVGGLYDSRDECLANVERVAADLRLQGSRRGGLPFAIAEALEDVGAVLDVIDGNEGVLHLAAVAEERADGSLVLLGDRLRAAVQEYRKAIRGAGR